MWGFSHHCSPVWFWFGQKGHNSHFFKFLQCICLCNLDGYIGMYVISFTHVDHWGARGLELMKSVQICMVVTITVGVCVCHCCSYPPWFSSLFSLCFLELRLLAFHRSHSFRTVLYGGYGCLVRLQNGYIFNFLNLQGDGIFQIISVIALFCSRKIMWWGSRYMMNSWNGVHH